MKAISSHRQEKQVSVLSASWFDTPLGEMTALADEQALYLLEFTDCRFIEHEINRLKEKTLCPIVPGETEPLRSIQGCGAQIGNFKILCYYPQHL